MNAPRVPRTGKRWQTALAHWLFTSPAEAVIARAVSEASRGAGAVAWAVALAEAEQAVLATIRALPTRTTGELRLGPEDVALRCADAIRALESRGPQ